jgi:hypothetical protein
MKMQFLALFENILEKNLPDIKKFVRAKDFFLFLFLSLINTLYLFLNIPHLFLPLSLLTYILFSYLKGYLASFSALFTLIILLYSLDYDQALFFILIIIWHQKSQNFFFLEQEKPIICFLKITLPLFFLLFITANLYQNYSCELIASLLVCGQFFGGYLTRHLPDGLDYLSMKTTLFDLMFILFAFYNPYITLLYLFSLGMLALYKNTKKLFQQSIALMARVFFVHGLLFYLSILSNQDFLFLIILCTPFYIHFLNESLCIKILPMALSKKMS